VHFRTDKLVLRTFGGLSLENGGRPHLGAAAQRGRLAILAVLAVAGSRGISRDKLLALFWPESDEERARGSLKQALYALRRDVGERELTLGTTDLRLNPDVISSDVGEFEAALQRGDQSGAIGLYAGPFLDSVLLKGLADFEEWSDYTRVRLQQAFRNALESLASEASARGDHVVASRWWQRCAAEDRLSERVARSYMEALVAAGERESAIRHGEMYVRLVQGRSSTQQPDDSFMSYLSGLANGRNDRNLTIPRLASKLVTAPHGSAEDTEVGSRAEPAALLEMESCVRSRARITSWKGRVALGHTLRNARVARIRTWPAALIGFVVIALGAVLVSRRDDMVHSDAGAVRSGRIAVATFDNLTGDTAVEYLGRLTALMITHRLQDAVTSDLVGPLAREFPESIRVTTDSSENGWLPPARSLEAGLLVQGTISRSEGSLEFRAQLVDVRTEAVIATLDPVLVLHGDIESGLSGLRDRVAARGRAGDRW
jgi:DNA-binding SARP family transcriptional activator/TolB-like protein